MDKNQYTKRKDARYKISQFFDESELHKFYMDITTSDLTIRATVADISINGAGFEIDSPDFTRYDKSGSSWCSLKVVFPGGNFSAEAKKVWSIILETDGSDILKGGMMFTSVSPEDKTGLLSFISVIEKNKHGPA